MKTKINIDFKFMAHRIFLSLRIAKRVPHTEHVVFHQPTALMHDPQKPPVKKGVLLRRHERLLEK